MSWASDLITDLVNRLNRRGLVPELCEDVPEHLWAGKQDSEGCCWWEIRPLENRWADEVEARFHAQFPRLFREFVDHYSFLAFEFGPLEFFDNTPDPNRFLQFRRKVLADEALLELLVPNGLLHFACPHRANYDPVCFDTRRGGANRDCPIMQVDHEEILCNNRLRIVRELAPSFHHLVEEQLLTLPA